MWWITLIIAAVIFLIFFIYLSFAYSFKFEGGSNAVEALQTVHSLSDELSPFKFTGRFSDIKASLFTKLITFIIAALCVHFFDNLYIPAIIYVIFVGNSIYMAWSRKVLFNKFFCIDESSLDEYEKEEFLHDKACISYVKKAYFTLPVYHIILLILLYVTYFLN